MVKTGKDQFTHKYLSFPEVKIIKKIVAYSDISHLNTWSSVSATITNVIKTTKGPRVSKVKD